VHPFFYARGGNSAPFLFRTDKMIKQLEGFGHFSLPCGICFPTHDEFVSYKMNSSASFIDPYSLMKELHFQPESKENANIVDYFPQPASFESPRRCLAC
jgi:hypothetical protein